MKSEILSAENLDEFIYFCKKLEFNEENLTKLEIIWQLNENEEIREKAFEFLKSYRDNFQLESVQKTFEIFRTINEVIPFSNFEKQINDFQYFKSNIPPYENYLTSNSTLVELLMNLGRKLFILFKLDEAAKDCFEIVLKNSPNQADAHYSIGRIAEKKFLYEKAVLCYEKALELDNNHFFAHMQSGIIKGSIFLRWKEAIIHFGKVLEQDPYAIEAYARIAEAYYHLEEFGTCRQFVEIALTINEFHEDALNLMGLLQWKIDKNTEAALETFQKGLDHKIHSDSAVLLKSLGDIYFEEFQDYEKAKLFYEKSLKVNFAQKKAIKQIVTILLHHFQDLKSVTNCYENYLSQVSDDFEMKTAYARFLIEHKHDFVNAEILLLESLKINENFGETLKLLNRIKDYNEENEHGLSDESDEDIFSGGNASGD